MTESKPFTCPYSLEVTSFSKTKHTTAITEQFFNHGVTIVMPGEQAVPQSLRDCLTHNFAYKLYQLPLHRLIEPPFVRAFVKKGSMHMLSFDTKLDCDDCVALAPNGSLLLDLTRDTYMELGLTATQTLVQKKFDKYLVKISLTAKSFKPGGSFYQRVMKCLKDRLHLKFNMLVSWVPHDSAVCGSSVGVHLSQYCRKIETVDPRPFTQVFSSLPIPKVRAADPVGKQGCRHTEVYEWLGSMAILAPPPSQAHIQESRDYASRFCCPEPSTNSPRVLVYQVRGFIPPQFIRNLLGALRALPRAPGRPFASLSVHGFTDAPTGPGMVARHYHHPQAPQYSYLLLPDDALWVFTSGAAPRLKLKSYRIQNG